MDFVVENSWRYWHLLPLILVAIICGILSHIGRGTLNPFPSRWSGSRFIDMAVSENYSFWDWYYKTEYDANGFYELNSFHNLRLNVLDSLLGAALLWFCFADIADTFGSFINLAVLYLGEVVQNSFQYYGLISG